MPELPGEPATRAPAAEPFIPPATIDDTLEIDGESIRARAIRTRMSVEVHVNDSGPYRFFVDSGADRSVIGSGLAERLQLPGEEPLTLHSTAGVSKVGAVRIEKLRIGKSEIESIVAPALPERFLAAQGLIGIDALADQRLMMDFEDKRITIQDSRRAERASSNGEEIVVTARRRKGQLIITQAAALKVGIHAVIDSGAEATLGNMALRDQIFAGRTPPTPVPVTLISVTGQALTADLIVIPSLRIGGIYMRNVPVAFVDAPPFALFGLADRPALLLGTDLLKTFRRVSLDFRSRKVRFALRP